MKSSPDLSLILPCYNEAPIFRESVKQILATLGLSRLSFEIIFVDDASSDGTQDLIKKLCKMDSRLPFGAQGKRGNDKKQCRALFHPVNEGRGKSVSDGFLAARGRVVGYIDIDLEVSPVYIPTIAQMILENQADCVIGKRMYRTSLTSILREVLSLGYQWLRDRLFGTGGLDTESGYKFFDRKKVLPLLQKTQSFHWFWDTEITILSQRAETPSRSSASIVHPAV